MTEQSGRSPLMEVAPVDLPAPAASSPRAPSLALRAFLAVGLLAGLFILAGCIVLGLVGMNLLVLQSGRVIVGLVIVTLAVVASIGRGLAAMIRKPQEPESEVEVPATEEPEVHQRLRDLARAVGTRPPDRVVVTAEVNAYVREFGPLMGLVRGTRTLAIGTPLLDVLTVAQLDAVLAHELGHLAGGDTRLGPLAFRTDQATMRMIASLRGRFVGSIFVAYWKFQHRMSAAVRRGQEVVADRASVRVAGRQAAADALQRIEITARAETAYRNAYLAPLLRSGCRPRDLTSGLREIVQDPQRIAELMSEAASADEPVDAWASHPPTVQRISRVAALTDPAAVAVDERPARALWRDPDRWSSAAHETWLELVTNSRTKFRKVAWERFGDETAGTIQRSRATDVDRALGRLGLGAGLEGVREAIHSGRGGSLAGELIASGWRAPGADERTSILIAAVTATAVRIVLDERAGQFRFSWSGPLVLANAQGRAIAVDDLARRAATGDWDSLDTALAPGPDQ